MIHLNSSSYLKPAVGELDAPECTVLYVGDIHGDYEFLAELVMQKNLIIIQLGDFNLGIKHFDIPVWELILESNNSYLIALRGNHDRPDYFSGKPKDTNRIAFVPDYTYMNINGVKHLFVGGAHSIDRLNIQHIKNAWFVDERVIPYNDAFMTSLKTVDVLCTHSAPTKVPPHEISAFVIQNAIKDPWLIDDLDAERKVLQRVLDTCVRKGMTKHYYGHFHKHMFTEFDGIIHRCLAENEVYCEPH